MKYLDGTTRDEAAEAYRKGIPLDRIAGNLRITVAELRDVLNLPPLKRSDPETGCDLWRTHELEGKL